MRKFLIFGSAGFVGANLVRYLLRKNKDIQLISVDRLETSSSMYNIYINRSHEFLIGDVNDAFFVNKIFELNSPDYVIYLVCTQNEDQMLQTNVVGLYNVLKATVQHKSDFIYLSNYKIYEPTPDKKVESSKLKSCDIFSASKIAAETVIQSLPNLDYNILRSSEIFGSRQRKGFIFNVIYNIIKNKPIEFSNSEKIRDIIYIDDLCNAIEFIINKNCNKKIFNVSSGNDFTDIELVNMICKEMEIDLSKLSLSPIQENFIQLDSSAIRNFGWKPERKIKESIQVTVKMLMNNRWIIEKDI